jgi:tyrosine-protein phosphatase YwqE
MSFLSNLFKAKSERNQLGVNTDIHSHLIPAIDDGVKTVQESVNIIKTLHKMGVNRIITTPHIMLDTYKNSSQTIIPGLEAVRSELDTQKIPVKIEAAAEYYLDEGIMEKLEKEQPLMTFGDNYLLFETSYINENGYFKTAVFNMKAQGYKPILAHPERYSYVYGNFKKLEEMYELGVYFQLNTNSLSGYYDKNAQKTAHKLIDAQMIDFIGSDCHGMRHINALKESIKTTYFEKLLQLELKNDAV